MKLLLHVCCGPDVTVALERLPDMERLTLYFDNPNIHPAEEYARRLEAFHKVADHFGAEHAVGRYDPESWLEKVRGHETDPEGGQRCRICIAHRLERTADFARSEGYDTIGSVFTTSPHKRSVMINELGEQAALRQGLSHFHTDLKKKDGFKRSVELSRELKIYRQNYCGCVYSATRLTHPTADK